MRISGCLILVCISVIHCDATVKTYNQGKSFGGYKSMPHGAGYQTLNSKQFPYRGQYQGQCGNDGFYYNDHGSFVICSNNNAYVQPCAPGSRNSGFDKYNPGDNYFYRDFCDINLVDHGYGVKSGYGHNQQGSYGKSIHTQAGYGTENSYNSKQHEKVPYNQKQIYHGMYEGHCGNDGFYYNNHGSFVICSNNNAYVQPCAPGSRNSGFDSYNFGDNYNYRDFCDINLVDQGYGVKDKYGYDQKSNQAKDQY